MLRGVVFTVGANDGVAVRGADRLQATELALLRAHRTEVADLLRDCGGRRLELSEDRQRPAEILSSECAALERLIAESKSEAAAA